MMNTDTKSIAMFQAPPMGSHYEGGQYNVYVRFPERNARNRRRMATNVHVQVRHTGGVEVSGDA
jgi:ubiquitin-protein ligase